LPSDTPSRRHALRPHFPARLSGAFLALPSPQSLLLIFLDDLRRANFRFVRVKPDVAKGTSLTQEVPALIQFDLDLREPFTIGFGVSPLLVQSVLLCDKALNMIEDRLIFGLILHDSFLQRGRDRNNQALMLRPPETAVNRCSDPQDDSGMGWQEKENGPGSISRRVAVRRLRRLPAPLSPHRPLPPYHLSRARLVT